MTSQMMANLLPIKSLEAYIHRVEQIPMLSPEQEKGLAIAYRDNDDLAAAQQLVLAHLRYVVRVAKGFQGYGLPLADLIQEGAIGLMKAVKQFQPAQGVRLVTFAVYWIKSEIHEFVIRNWRIVKMATTKAQRKCFFNIRSQKDTLRCFTAQEVQEVAADLGVKPETVRQMEQRFSAPDVAFDPLDTDDDDSSAFLAPAQHLSLTGANPIEILEAQEKALRKTKLMQALEHLDARAQDILQKRWLSDQKTPFKSLSATHGISIERVRQIEKSAIGTLTHILNSDTSI